MASNLQSARDASCTAIRESMIGSGCQCFRRLQTRLALVQTALWSARRRNMHQTEADSCFEAAVRVAKEAGKVARDGYHSDKRVLDTKASAADLVTETDRKVEELILSGLRREYPTHSFIGEESVSDGGSCDLTDTPTWMVDPIDGTMNFVHKIPLTAISIGLWANKEPVVGVMYNFVTDELFAAQKGKGATVNSKPLCVSQCTELSKAVVIAEMGNDRVPENLKIKEDNLRALFAGPDSIRGVRMFGSAVLNMCMVAAGSADAYFEYGVHCWDMAAGALIVQEAGGVVLDPKGGPLDVMKRGVLCASSEALAAKLSERIQPINYPPDTH